MQHLTLLLPLGALLLPLASTTPTPSPEPPSYGHWDLAYAYGNAASGYRWENVNANYSASPEAAAVAVAVQCKQLYDPTTRETTRSCDDASFGYEVTAEGELRCKCEFCYLIHSWHFHVWYRTDLR